MYLRVAEQPQKTDRLARYKTTAEDVDVDEGQEFMFPERLRSQIERRFVTMMFAGNPVVRALDTEEASLATRRLASETRGAREIDRAMREQGLVAVHRRARGYTPFSRGRARP